ncbi:3'-5' exoribonuclease [Vogesella oryzae]|uniref:3'-5' exoribonuclease n=1 Tax=Vogesella oryzae TaxID=1735285 RepID=UPI001582F6BE|nr:3'-5' exoribonuclease [Vogesella oryzae]
MLIFLDTEFTDFIDCELISIGMVGEDGRHELYLEVQDFDRSKCNAFVQSAVWSQLGRIEEAIVRKVEVQARLRAWFATLPRSVTIACDSQHDRDLLANALEGEWPNNLSGWFDLRPLIDTGVFDRAVTQYHTKTHPWHHALHDAHAHRAGWLAWMDQRRRGKLEAY